MFHIAPDRRSPGRFADRIRIRRHRQQRTVSADEQFEVYTDLATLLAAGDDAARDVALG